MTPFETIARLVEAATTLLKGVAIMAAIVVLTLVCMAAWQNYQSSAAHTAAVKKLAATQVACGEYGNGRAWTAAKRGDFLAKTGGSDGR